MLVCLNKHLNEKYSTDCDLHLIRMFPLTAKMDSHVFIHRRDQSKILGLNYFDGKTVFTPKYYKDNNLSALMT